MTVPRSAAGPQRQWQRLPYRLRQFWRGLHPTVTPAEVKAAAAILPPAAFALFQRLSVDAQRHGLNVWQTLARQPDQLPDDLAVAALLHDVGKMATVTAGLSINVWWRSLLVLLEMSAPALLTRWAVADPQAGWRYLFHVHLAHPAIGAEWAAASGCSPVTCWLIAQHQDKGAAASNSPAAQLLARLQWADSQN